MGKKVEGKKPWLSKTLWSNFLLAVLSLFVPPVRDFFLENPKVLPVIFAGVNFVLRLITKDRIVLGD